MLNDSMAAERHVAGEARFMSSSLGSSRKRRALARRLVALPLAIVLLAPSASAPAAETTTGYNQTPPPPKTETTTGYKQTPPAPKQGAAPTKTSSTPAATTSEPAATSTAPSAKTLPFTGLDLRWVIVGGVLLLGAGLSIVFVQRTRHGTGR